MWLKLEQQKFRNENLGTKKSKVLVVAESGLFLSEYEYQ